MNLKTALTVKRILELFIVDLEEGTFVHKRSCGLAKAGTQAGYIRKNGYREICIDRERFFEQNVLWFVATGSWPPIGYEVDHENRDRLDNRRKNLRLATRSQNNANMKLRSDNKVGFRGVHFNKEKQKFCAQVTKDRKTISLGYFLTAKQAAIAVAKTRDALFGEYTFHPNL